MTKNKLADLNDHLFAQMERLSEESLTKEELEQEVERTQSIVKIADQIVNTATLQITSAKLVAEHGSHISAYLPQIKKPEQKIISPPKDTSR